MEILGYIASLAMGIILGLMGGGGSILTVPIMVYFFHFPPTVAAGYSLFIVGVTALIGSAMSIRKGEIDFRAGFSFAIPSIIGVTLSRGFILPRVPDVILSFSGFNLTKEILIMATFALLMIAASYSMIRKRSERKAIENSSILHKAFVVVEGFIVGVIAGFVGAGGGFLIIPALVLVIGLHMRVAIGTSLMIIALQSLIGFAGDILRGAFIDWPLLLIVSVIAILGIVIGSTFASKIEEQKLKISFGWFVLAMGIAILFEQGRHLSLN